jgi:hypothetical protein
MHTRDVPLRKFGDAESISATYPRRHDQRDQEGKFSPWSRGSVCVAYLFIVLILNWNRYERILQRIKLTSHPDEWVKAKKLLGWMVCAKRQLTWKEIQVALSINVEDQTIDYDDKSLRTHIHDICGSLVLRSGDRVTLVHSTAKTYVLHLELSNDTY